MGAYLALALANTRPDNLQGIIGLAPGCGQNLVAQIKAIYGTYQVVALNKPTVTATGAHRLNEPQHGKWLMAQLSALTLQN